MRKGVRASETRSQHCAWRVCMSRCNCADGPALACPGLLCANDVIPSTVQSAIDKGLFQVSAQWSARVALRALLRTAREVALGVQHLHHNNVLHGDLKPGVCAGVGWGMGGQVGERGHVREGEGAGGQTGD